MTRSGPAYRPRQRRLPRRHRRSRGFTIIEMMVATVVLAIGVVATMVCISQATRSTRVAMDYSTAAMLAQKHIAELEIEPTEISGGSASGDFMPDFPGYSWEQSVDTTPYTNLLQVTLVISWGQGRGRHAAQFVTYEPNVAPNYGNTSGTGTTGTGGTGNGG